MKVRELIEKLQAFEDQDMEVVAIDHEYGAYRLDDPEIRDEYASGYTKAKVVVLDDNCDSLNDLDEKYLTREEPPKRSGRSMLLPNTLLQEVFMSRLVPENTIFITNKENLPPDATHVEFPIYKNREDQSEGS